MKLSKAQHDAVYGRMGGGIASRDDKLIFEVNNKGIAAHGTTLKSLDKLGLVDVKIEYGYFNSYGENVGAAYSRTGRMSSYKHYTLNEAGLKLRAELRA